MKAPLIKAAPTTSLLHQPRSHYDDHTKASHPATISKHLHQATAPHHQESQLPTLSEKSTLTYAIACDQQKTLHLQITANTGGGFFSQEWVPLTRIQQILKECAATKAITSICLWPLFRGQSVNTPAFLLAVLRAEKLVRPLPGRQRVHELCDPADFQTRMDKLVAWVCSLRLGSLGRDRRRRLKAGLVVNVDRGDRIHDRFSGRILSLLLVAGCGYLHVVSSARVGALAAPTAFIVARDAALLQWLTFRKRLQ
jgi:hypothetical protein